MIFASLYTHVGYTRQIVLTRMSLLYDASFDIMEAFYHF
jgi:hypothetical protein